MMVPTLDKVWWHLSHILTGMKRLESVASQLWFDGMLWVQQYGINVLSADIPCNLMLCKALEFQAQQRLWTLQQQEIAAAGTSALQDAAAAQTAALAAEQQRKAAEWQVEDDARTLRQQHETARRARLVAAAEQEAAKQAAKGLLLAQELQAQEELLKVQLLTSLQLKTSQYLSHCVALVCLQQEADAKHQVA